MFGNKPCFEPVLQISNCNSYNYKNKPSIYFLREKKDKGVIQDHYTHLDSERRQNKS